MKYGIVFLSLFILLMLGSCGGMYMPATLSGGGGDVAAAGATPAGVAGGAEDPNVKLESVNEDGEGEDEDKPPVGDNQLIQRH